MSLMYRTVKRYYDKVWNLVTSGEIQLECDLHFTDGQTKYIVDFKQRSELICLLF